MPIVIVFQGFVVVHVNLFIRVIQVVKECGRGHDQSQVFDAGRARSKLGELSASFRNLVNPK